jgi:cytochrome c-type biogenesis protein CcmE
METKFMLHQGATLLSVVYVGSDPLPDTFRDNATALADGRLGSDGVFRANKIQAKCASKYEAKPNQKGVSHPAQMPDKISSLR